ncbi:MAG: hypothetical protein A2845_05695 [Candidatus Lloydbacteria bacterium RIFCSPHIGHO2_01_FULL_49_22]|uniref:DUF2007 domain-containing protein n=1 Tax=Candidatus Lloydbacteria bacterium RIFCSPHIGHO2_01_FULL_49_22 TaxID=1798658 RepID=A0A1G2CVP1_9BACT|nr:MAG: hypothetical protein A2845_05695 [Candidatus Lloydbacteria bacterium RIFCSPHIGHO2_01_FULL_49_22]OGZ09821.1 MAG: hypothetical protein A3C14_00320 [Candidatus Lloydbacteria bacterium RIFCSPHIGHO2_02_FULL_50_18]
MSTRIKFFREADQARDTRQFLITHGIKSFIRNREGARSETSGEAFGFDLFALREEDVDEARTLLNYEFGSGWGEDKD